MNLKLPYQFSNEGLTGSVTYKDHIRNMIEQIIFTGPGERVNRPDFGSGLLQAVFEPASNEMVATTQYLVQSALNQWLGQLILVNEVFIEHVDSSVEVNVSYTILKSMENQIIKVVKQN